MPLGLTKVAFGCKSLEALVNRVARVATNGELRVPTRMRPKRADECVGGHLHFIVKHRIIARVEILRFDERKDGRLNIVCSDQVEVVPARPKRAHQGWRYLEESDAPGTDGDASGIAELPPRLYGKLASLNLV
jgi:hypothetical protein